MRMFEAGKLRQIGSVRNKKPARFCGGHTRDHADSAGVIGSRHNAGVRFRRAIAVEAHDLIATPAGQDAHQTVIALVAGVLEYRIRRSAKGNPRWPGFIPRQGVGYGEIIFQRVVVRSAEALNHVRLIGHAT